MKSLFLKSIALSFIALSLWSCKKDETKTIATSGTAGSLQSSVSSVVLDKTLLTKEVINFTFTKADFGYQAAITNTLQIALKGSNFAAAKEIVLDANVTKKAFNGLDFNNLLLSLALPTNASSNVEVRIKSSLSTTTTPVYSNVVALSVKPFPLTAWVYVVGQFNGWKETNPDSLISEVGNGVYTGTINFPATDPNFEFKIITNKGSWAINYGDAGGQALALNASTNLNAKTAGSKFITIDLNTLKWTVEEGKPWSIIGNAIPGTNWDKDIDLKSLNDGKGTWTVTADLAVGEFKFRFNHDWGTSIGDGANNIKITTAGNYTIKLTVSADGKSGTYTLVKN